MEYVWMTSLKSNRQNNYKEIVKTVQTAFKIKQNNTMDDKDKHFWKT